MGPSGPCYLVLHERVSQQYANYACHLAGATLASYATRQDEVLPRDCTVKVHKGHGPVMLLRTSISSCAYFILSFGIITPL